MKDDNLVNDLELLVARIKHEMNSSKQVVKEAGDPNDARDIGSKLQIVLTTFNSNEPIDAKVDTGAEMSSLRVNNLKINENQGACSFNFYGKNVTMGYEGFQAVKLGDKTENRPIVTFNVVVPTKDPNEKDITVSNVKFNINDVPDQEIVAGDNYMDVLLGMNFITAGKFKVVGRATQTEGVEGFEILDDEKAQILRNSVKDIVSQLIHWAGNFKDPNEAMEFMLDEIATQIRNR